MEKALHKLLATLLFVSLGITTGWAHAVNKQTVEADNPVQPEEEVQTVDLPYSIVFDEDPTAEAGWTVVDNSLQSGTTWTYGSYTTFEGSRLGMGMQADYGGGPNGAGPNDYLVSPAFSLEAGKTYTIDMSYTTYQTGGNILLEYGTDINDVSSFTQFATAQKDGNKYYPNDKFELTVPEDGVYYIALHAKAVESSNYAYTYVFDFAVSEKPEEVEPKPLPYSIAFDEDPTAEAGWTVVDKSLQSGTTWTYGSYTTFEGSRLGMGMQADYGGGPNGAGPNDYLVSPAFSLEAGKTYTIDMSYTTYQTGGNILLEYGTDINDVSSFTQFATAQKDGNKYYPNDKFELTVPEDGVYYIALHAKAVESSNYAYTYVFDFAVSEKPEEVKPVDLPYSVAFDEDPTAEAGWTVVDKSLQSGTTWTYGSYTTFEGSRLGMGMQADYGGGPNGAGPNDYLVSPAFSLEAGKTYTIDMSYTTYQTGGNILLEYGTDINDVSSFTQFATAQKDGNGYYPNDKFELTVPEDGVYYIALHAKAVESSNYAYTYVFDFAVSEKPEEVEPTPLPYSIAFDEDPTAEAGWTVVDKSLQSGTTWTYGSYTTFEGSRLGMGMQADYGGGPNGAGPNDYLVSPAFSLEAGKTYTIDMSYTTYQTGGNILLEYGTDITDVSSFTQFATAQKNGNGYYPNDKFELTVPEDGVYYIALHAKAVESSNYAYTYVFDFAVSEKPEEVEPTPLPYSIAFDEDPTAEAGWTVVDKSLQSGTTWTYGSYTTFEGSRLGMGMQADYGGGPNGAGPNDYLVSPAFSLEAGKTYTIDMSYTTYQTGGNILLEYGTDINDVSSFTQFATAQKDGNKYYPNDKFELTVPEDGVYYIALHAKAVESSNYAYTYVFDFAVSEKPEEVEPTPLPYSIAFDEDPTAEAGWTVVDNSLQSGTTWTYGSYTTFEGSRLGMGMQADYGGGPNGAGPNDYLVSPAFSLEAGKTYTIDMSYTTYQTGGNILLEYGTDINDVSSFTQFATAQKDGNKYYPNDKFELTVPEDGVYYIALHAKAVESSNYAYTYVFDFAVSEAVPTGINGMSSIPTNAVVTVYTVDGRIAGTNADFRNLAKGTYIVTVKADGKTQSFKIVK